MVLLILPVNSTLFSFSNRLLVNNQDIYRVNDPLAFEASAEKLASNQYVDFLDSTTKISDYTPILTVKQEMEQNLVKNLEQDEQGLLNNTESNSIPNHTVVLVDDDQKFTKENNPFYILGAYPEIKLKYLKASYDKTNYGLFNDEDYCQIVDYYNLAHPENMFEQMNVFADYGFKGAGITS